MKTILKLALLLCYVSAAYGQSPLTPSILMGGMVSAGGTGAPGSWSPLTGTGGTVVAGTPHTLAGLLYSTDGTGHPGTWAYWTGTSSGGGAIGAAGAIQTASGTSGGFADGGCTAVSGTITCAGTGPSQLGLTYNATPLVPGSATTAVYGVNSSGQAVISEAGGTPARLCDATNGVCATSGVTSFSAGTLSPLFTTSVATATSTPALTFALSNAAANTVFGNFTGSSAAPGFSTNPVVGTISTISTGNGYYGFALSGVTTCVGATPTCSGYIYETAAGDLQASSTTVTDGLGRYLAKQFVADALDAVTFSATPTFDATTQRSRIVLTATVTSSTLAAGTDGARKCFDIVQGASSFTFAWPSNLKGGGTIGNTNGGRNTQCFAYWGTETAWLAEAPMVMNQ